jgi:hypothetical protein
MTTKKDTRLAAQTDLNREFVAPRGEEWKWFFAVLIVFTLVGADPLIIEQLPLGGLSMVGAVVIFGCQTFDNLILCVPDGLVANAQLVGDRSA